jgi:hypothetical protein
LQLAQRDSIACSPSTRRRRHSLTRQQGRDSEGLKPLWFAGVPEINVYQVLADARVYGPEGWSALARWRRARLPLAHYAGFKTA